MKFSYKAIGADGKVYTSAMSAESREELYSLLKEREETLVHAEEVQTRSLTERINSIPIFRRVKDEEKVVFARNAAAMLEAGLPMARVLSVMQRQTKNVYFQSILATLQADIQKGIPLSGALKNFPKVFSHLFVSMVAAGEESGKIVESFREVADQIERTYKLKRKIRGAMMYPSIVLFAMVIIAVLMLIYVVPTLTETFRELNTDLPATTRAVIGVSEFLKYNVLLVLIAFIGFIGGIVSFFRTPKGRRIAHFIVLRIPLIKGLVKEINAARTAGTLSSLLSSGVEIVQAITITQDVIQNTYYKDILSEVAEEVKTGGQISEVLRKYEALYPPLMGEMAAVGEETGQLSGMFTRVAEFYEEDVEQKTKDMSTIIEPFLMILIGGMVGFFALSMIAPMYSLSSAI